MITHINKNIASLVVALLIGLAFAIPAAQAGSKVHRLAVHVDSGDPKVQNLALNNVENVYKYYSDKGEKVMIEVVTYGPGLHMLRSDTSKVKARVEAMSLGLDGVSFAACGNTQRKMSKKEGKKVPIMTEAKHVPSGVVRLVELQEAGWSYIRP